MWAQLYTLGMRLYVLAIRVSAWRNDKAKQWLAGRKDFWHRHENNPKDGDTWVWFHCASLGEFEQGRPVMEAIKKDYPGISILLSFFSPSGYHIRKNYDLADKVIYLPLDLPKNAKRFVQVFQPKLAVFVKYEFWHNYLIALHEAKIPYFFISASFRPSQPFFRPWGAWFRKQLRHATQIFVQDQGSADLLHKHDIQQVTLSGDTRYDRVLFTAAHFEGIPLVADFTRDKLTLVAGSTWPPDEDILLSLTQAYPDLCLIIAPHEVAESRISGLLSRFGKEAIRYSSLPAREKDENRVLIIDNIGMLSRLYYYGDIAYVGGAFGSGLHNILEPAAHGKPVLFGPRHLRFTEAAALVDAGGGFSVLNSQALINKVSELLHDESALQSAARAAKEFVDNQQGATARIMKTLGPLLQTLHQAPISVLH